MLTEEVLIEYIKPILKSKGFKKKGKRWRKVYDEFTCVFFIQGSCYDKNDYYIRPGIFINELTDKTTDYYGHIHTEIPVTTPNEILEASLAFFDEWTNMIYMKKMLIDFMEWDRRNPLEKRRAGEVNYDMDPPPTRLFFALSPIVSDYILKQ